MTSFVKLFLGTVLIYTGILTASESTLMGVALGAAGLALAARPLVQLWSEVRGLVDSGRGLRPGNASRRAPRARKKRRITYH